ISPSGSALPSPPPSTGPSKSGPGLPRAPGGKANGATWCNNARSGAGTALLQVTNQPAQGLGRFPGFVRVLGHLEQTGAVPRVVYPAGGNGGLAIPRSEEHTSELQSRE